MIPTTLLSVIIFLLLIAPGVLWDHLAIELSISPRESTFRETSRVIFSSMVVSALSLEIMLFLWCFKPKWFPDLKPFLSDPAKYYHSQPLIVWRTILMETFIAFVIVLAGHFREVQKQGWKLGQVSPWQKVFRSDLPDDDMHPFARVRLASGSVFIGRVSDYSPDFEIMDREIVLCQPLYSRTAETDLKAMPPEWDRVILATASIDSISVQYRKFPDIKGKKRKKHSLGGFLVRRK